MTFCPIIPAVLTGSSVNASCAVISVAVKRYIWSHIILNLTSNNRKKSVNVVTPVKRFKASSVKCWTENFCIHATCNKGPLIIMDQLHVKSIYHSPFKYSHSRQINTCFLVIASNVTIVWLFLVSNGAPLSSQNKLCSIYTSDLENTFHRNLSTKSNV